MCNSTITLVNIAQHSCQNILSPCSLFLHPPSSHKCFCDQTEWIRELIELKTNTMNFQYYWISFIACMDESYRSSTPSPAEADRTWFGKKRESKCWMGCLLNSFLVSTQFVAQGPCTSYGLFLYTGGKWLQKHGVVLLLQIPQNKSVDAWNE